MGDGGGAGIVSVRCSGSTGANNISQIDTGGIGRMKGEYY